jgi:hypothetical protein
MIFAWWPPVPADYAAYAGAGFNIALTRPDVYCNAEAKKHGSDWYASHDGMFEASVEQSEQLAKLGVLSVFTSGTNPIPHSQFPRDTVAYGNRTGGVIPGNKNLTKAPFAFNPGGWEKGVARAFMITVPEVEYMLQVFAERNISHRWGGLFLHDDTVTQESYVIKVAEYLSEKAPWMVPIVNQQMGNSGPETLYRSKLCVTP